MIDLINAPSQRADGTQDAALAALAELEARWENTPKADAAGDARGNLNALLAKQSAFDDYRTKLVAYDSLYKPVYRSARLLTTPFHLAKWCRVMCHLHGRLDAAARATYPVQLMAKAYRAADRIAQRAGVEPISRAAQAGDAVSAACDFEAVAKWCGTLAGVPASPL